MKRKLQMSKNTSICKSLMVAFAFIATFIQTQAQNQVYWREGFEPGSTPPCTIPTTSTGVATPGTGIGYFTMGSGTWYIAGAYRTTGTACTNNSNGPNHIRFSNQINDANFATSGVDTAYVVTPVVDAGIKELHFLRARASRALSIYTRDDTSATATTGWNLVGVAPSFAGTVTCQDTTFLINSGTAKRLKIVSKRSTTSGTGLDNDIDSVWITSVGVIIIPVEIVSFTGKRQGNTNELTWATASERNNAAFVIERSSNGIDFQSIGTVKGRGNSSAVSNYTFADEAPLSINYYRLRQLDMDGKATVSKTVTIADRNKQGILKTYPSVTDAVLSVDYASTGDVVFKVMDILGKTVLSQQVKNNDGLNTTQLDVSALANGMYVLSFESATMRMVQKFEKR